jgi:diphosphomevalonate decarboxylase
VEDRSVELKASVAVAHSNIALCKYWGKSDAERNLPAVPSLSLTLEALRTTTRVAFDPALTEDEIHLNGALASPETKVRIQRLLTRVRNEAKLTHAARVSSENDFPTAAGLASSASGFAALALAARHAAGLDCALDKVSALARASSVSAARSVFGGFVTLEAGAEYARPFAASPGGDLCMVIALTQRGSKATGSTQGMLHTQQTSPYYEAWRTTAPTLYAAMLEHLSSGELESLGEGLEQSALMMHASMLAARPALVYFAPPTLAAMQCVYELRRSGIFAYFTMDAGPHVKVLTLQAHRSRVKSALTAVPGVHQVIESSAGPGAHLVDP